MAIPSYRIPFYRNPAFGTLCADVVLLSVTAATLTKTVLARSGSLSWMDRALIAAAFGAGGWKAYRAYADRKNTRAFSGLEGCLQTLHHALLASAEEGELPVLRLTIYRPVRASSVNLEQLLDYISNDPKRRKGAGRQFSQHCGIIGLAYRTGQTKVAFREVEDAEAYIQELVSEWNYSEDQARGLELRGKSFMAVPLAGDSGIEAVLFIDSTKPDYFSKNRIDLIQNACSGIALFIGRTYNKKAD